MYDFHQTETSRAGKVFLYTEYMGGDADTEHPSEFELPNITFDNFDTPSSLAIIEGYLTDYEIIHDLLDIHGEAVSYDDVLKEHGDDIANLYDNVPRDPQGDYQFPCKLDKVKIFKYDNQGNKFETYNLL